MRSSGWKTGPVLILLAFACILPVGRRAAAQAVSLEAKGATLREIVARIETQTGYEFRLAVGQQIEEARRDFSCKDLSLSQVLSRLSAAFKCDVFSLDSTGFFVIPAQKPPDREVAVGSYRLRVNQPVTTEEEGVLQLTLVFAAPDDETMEAVAGLGSELRITDNFGRTLVDPSVPGIRGTSATRVRPNEYWHRLPLALRDTRATRIRSISGSLVLYRRVTPLRFEFPLDRPERTQSELGVEIRLAKFAAEGREYVASTRLSWPEERNAVGRGIARTPQPYLVDERGRVYRDSSIRQTTSRGAGGELIRDQTARFEGLEARPVRLVYEILVKEHPEVVLPFQVSGLALPEREKPRTKPEQRPFYAAPGGSLSFLVVDREGRPVEGEVSLGLSRRDDPARGPWSGWRWIDLLADPAGRVTLTALRPGAYRVLRMFRLDPTLPPVLVQRAPAEVVVTAGKDSRIPALRLPVAAPPDP